MDDPAGWAWPMAITLVCAPVIYPWYLLFFTPFLLDEHACSRSGPGPFFLLYLVWEWAQFGARWRVPAWLMTVDAIAVCIALLILMISARRRNLAPDWPSRPWRLNGRLRPSGSNAAEPPGPRHAV